MFLFNPADAVNMPPPSENGTPQPKDEPFAENPPHGAIIDYYLKAAPAGPVTIEILDAAGKRSGGIRATSVPAPVDPDTLNIPAFWVRPASRRRPRRACIAGCGTSATRRFLAAGGGGPEAGSVVAPRARQRPREPIP